MNGLAKALKILAEVPVKRWADPNRPDFVYGKPAKPGPDETPEEKAARLREVDEFVADYNARLAEAPKGGE